MKKIAQIISAIYILSVIICIFCVPISAIMLICKLTAATSASWFACCVPLIISIAASPIMIIAKMLIDNKEG